MKKQSEIWFPLAFTLVLLAAWVTYNAIAYEDWKCAFARCVRVENVK